MCSKLCMIDELQTSSGDLMAWFFTPSYFCSPPLVGIDIAYRVAQSSKFLFVGVQ